MRALRNALAALLLLLGPLQALAGPPGGSAPPFSALNAIPNVFNFSPTSLPRYRAKLARALSGGAPVNVGFRGDSTTVGLGSGTSGTTNGNGARVNAYPTQLANLFNAAGLSASPFNNFGGGAFGTTANITLYDPNIVFGANWGTASGFNNICYKNTVGTDSIAYTPPVATDTVTVWYENGLGAGSMTVNDGATPIGTVTFSAGSATLQSATFTRTASTNTINLTRVSGTVIVEGIVAYNSAVHKANFYNWGWSGSASSVLTVGYNSGPTGVFYGDGTINPDLIVLSMGINDINPGLSVATYQANMQAYITQQKSLGIDMVFVLFYPLNVANYTALWPAYQAAAYQLAAQNNIPLIDLTARYGGATSGYAVMNAQGNYYDNLHETKQGYADYAMAVWQLLKPQ